MVSFITQFIIIIRCSNKWRKTHRTTEKTNGPPPLIIRSLFEMNKNKSNSKFTFIPLLVFVVIIIKSWKSIQNTVSWQFSFLWWAFRPSNQSIQGLSRNSDSWQFLDIWVEDINNLITILFHFQSLFMPLIFLMNSLKSIISEYSFGILFFSFELLFQQRKPLSPLSSSPCSSPSHGSRSHRRLFWSRIPGT